MSPLLYALGRWSARRRWLVVIGWAGILLALGAGALFLGRGLDNSISIPGTESQAAMDRLAATFPQATGTSAQIVVVGPDDGPVDTPAIESAVADTVSTLKRIDGVSTVSSPFEHGQVDTSTQLSPDGKAAIIVAQLDGSFTTVTEEQKDAIREAGAHLQAALPEAQVAVGGEVFSHSMPELSITEGVGLIVALVVLILTLGSFIAAGMPIITAIVGVGATMGGPFLATSVATISSSTPLLALMLGLAVGIDYALFLISRHQEQLRRGVDPEESIGRTTATAGSAVIFAGGTVVIALVGLCVANIPFLTTMGIAAAIGVAAAVLVALTLVPAMLGFAGLRVKPGHRRERRAARRAAREAVPGAAAELLATSSAIASDEAAHAAAAQAVSEHRPNRFFDGWARVVTRRPIVTIVLTVAALGALTLPAAGLRLALPDAGALPASDTARVAYDLTSEHFGAGYNGPLIVTGSIVTSDDPLGLVSSIADELRALPGVASVPLATPNQTADTAIFQVVPTDGPDSQATNELVTEIRSLKGHFHDEYGFDLAVTGLTAVGIDVSDRLGSALLPFGIVVVGLSLLLLMIVFRSLWVPLKASLGYLLSIGASFGVCALVFNDGFMAGPLNVAQLGPVISFMPIVLMGILFGLAMDYEVFLVSRMREEYVHTGDAAGAVRRGFVGSAKVVTAAAVIMFAVFAAFIPEGDANLKPIALGLAVGVFIDAFVVRMTLVPAVMKLLGARAWWFPHWLDRMLPALDIEGDGLQRELALAQWPRPGSTLAIAAEDVGVADGRRELFRGLDVQAEPGSALLVNGGADRHAATAALLALTGRMRPTEGRLKVAGYSLPERGSAVRARAAYVDLDAVDAPSAAVREALAERPAILAIDGADRVWNLEERARIRTALAAAPAPVTLVLGALDLATARELLPPGAPTQTSALVKELR